MEPNNPYQDLPQAMPASQAGQMMAAGGGVKMTFQQLWLSFDGRIPRKAYWIYGVLPLIGVSLAAGIVAGILNLKALSMLVSILLIWPSIALAAKRWHDRDKSAWWILIGLVPMIGWLWTFIENGCLRGTTGPNRFGGDATGMY